MKIKTIDINAMEWFDKINGNSYFSATIDINYKLADWITLKLPFQYGYGEHYKEMAWDLIKKELNLDTKGEYSFWRFCEENTIILRANKKENCLKRELEAV